MDRAIYILGIGGTFMASLALLAREQGFSVKGVDQALYPPMSDQLAAAGIDYDEGYAEHRLATLPEGCQIIVGNAISRGNPALEYALDNRLSYISAPQWIAENVLAGRHVLAVSGTHGKTTTASMLAWILECAGLNPGFLIGGVPENFAQSARQGSGEYFVIEADEYDSAFCDKRSKFIHYRPSTLIINNVEFDHADIFRDLDAIQTQFHHLVRTLPASATICLHPSPAIENILARGCWSQLDPLAGANSQWRVSEISDDCSRFQIARHAEPETAGQSVDDSVGEVDWGLIGQHNLDNALAAVAAAASVGVPVDKACAALGQFASVKRRMQLIAEFDQLRIYDDFAHHPTAMRTTLDAAKRSFPGRRILAVVEAGSNTMRSGVHDTALPEALAAADAVFLYRPGATAELAWPANASAASYADVEGLVDAVVDTVVDGVGADSVGANSDAGDIVLIMSNGGFAGLHARLLEQMALQYPDLRRVGAN